MMNIFICKQVALYAMKCLIRVWNVKYNSIHCAANLLAGLATYHVSLYHEINSNNLSCQCA